MISEQEVERRKHLVLASMALHEIDNALTGIGAYLAEEGNTEDEKMLAALIVLVLGLPGRLDKIRGLIKHELHAEISGIAERKAQVAAS